MDPNQSPRSVASDPDLHYLQVLLFNEAQGENVLESRSERVASVFV